MNKEEKNNLSENTNLLKENNPMVMETTGIKSKKDFSKGLLEILDGAKIDISEKLVPPQVCLHLMDSRGKSVLATHGNFSMLIGKAKSRKTFLVTVCLAAAVKNDLILGKFHGCLQKNHQTVLYFDTEQGKYHVQKSVRNICSLSGISVPKNLKAFSLRKFSAVDRLKLIEAAIYSTPDLGFVVIDGIRDLVTSINDEEQASMISNKLLQWTEEKNIHILTVLHQNKADNNARGHLGSELQNKAETVLSVSLDSKNKDVSIVKAEYCRDQQPEAFAFGIDESGLPKIMEDWQHRRSEVKTKKSDDVLKLPKEKQLEMLSKVFQVKSKPKYSELQNEVKNAFTESGISIGSNKVKEFIKHCVTEKYLSKLGKDRSPDVYYVLTDK